jgi:hypothetical protein
MIIFLLSFLHFFGLNSLGCEIPPQVGSIYSLSGPVTQFLDQYGLLKSPQIKGVSSYHSTSEKHLERLPGGIYLGHPVLKKLQGAKVFYDESKELSKLFTLYPQINTVEVKTRGQGPLETLMMVHSLVAPLTKGCEFNQLAQPKARLTYLKGLIRPSQLMVFYLGRIMPHKTPDLIMANDGIVKWLRQEAQLQSYPSEMPYVNWSAKILGQLPPHLKVGLIDSSSAGIKKVERVGNGINLTYPGVLTPGLGQIEAMIYLFENLVP